MSFLIVGDFACLDCQSERPLAVASTPLTVIWSLLVLLTPTWKVTAVEVPLRTAVPLNSVTCAIRSISATRSANSAFSVTRSASPRVPFALWMASSRRRIRFPLVSFSAPS